jgi:hypothetical protein
MGKPPGIAGRPIAAPSAASHLNWIEHGMTKTPPEGGLSIEDVIRRRLGPAGLFLARL